MDCAPSHRRHHADTRFPQRWRGRSSGRPPPAPTLASRRQRSEPAARCPPVSPIDPVRTTRAQVKDHPGPVIVLGHDMVDIGTGIRAEQDAITPAEIRFLIESTIPTVVRGPDIRERDPVHALVTPAIESGADRDAAAGIVPGDHGSCSCCTTDWRRRFRAGGNVGRLHPRRRNHSCNRRNTGRIRLHCRRSTRPSPHGCSKERMTDPGQPARSRRGGRRRRPRPDRRTGSTSRSSGVGLQELPTPTSVVRLLSTSSLVVRYFPAGRNTRRVVSAACRAAESS
jgi:hypothetical protein